MGTTPVGMIWLVRTVGAVGLIGAVGLVVVVTVAVTRRVNLLRLGPVSVLVAFQILVGTKTIP
jgi:hypothetical protein